MPFPPSLRLVACSLALGTLLIASAMPPAHAFDEYLAVIKEVQVGDTDALRARIVRGEDMNHQDEAGKTGLTFAVIAGNAALTKLLLQGGARPQIRDSDGRVALHWAVQKDNSDVVAALLDGGAAIDTLDPHGTTPLMMAAESGNLAVIRLLIQRHANLQLRDYTGRSALDFAEGTRQSRAATLLRQAGAS